MKTIIFIGMMFIVTSCLSQTNLSERDAIRESHIDLTKQQVYFEIHGLIELDGHTFLGDTCSNPIMFFANADGVEIRRKTGDEKYKHRVCGVKDCPILHLDKIGFGTITVSQPSWYYRFNQLNTVPCVIQDGVK